MIRLSVLYPHSAGARFDFDYYLNRHIPMAREKIGTACKSVIVEQGLSGGAPASSPPYVLMAHILFDSVEALQSALAQHGPVIMADVPNYTSIEPVIQIGEVKVAE